MKNVSLVQNLLLASLCATLSMPAISAGKDAGHGKDYRTFSADGTVAYGQVGDSYTADLVMYLAGNQFMVMEELIRDLLYGESEGAVILDVREADSAAQSRLTDSVNVSRGLFEMKIHKLSLRPDTLTLSHCAGGGRASLAARTLQEMGYTNVHAITAKFEDILEKFG